MILANQFADMLAAGAITVLADLMVGKAFQRIGQKNVHRVHGVVVEGLAKVGKARCSNLAARLAFQCFRPAIADGINV